MDNKTVLYVSGFSSSLRARELAYDFERYGRLVRCDIPALKSSQSTPFAFIEYRRGDDAEDAYYDMHGRMIDGRRISVQWAKRPPSSQWRHEGGPRPVRDGRSGYDDRRRSPPPPSRDYDTRHSDRRDYDRDSRDYRGPPSADDRSPRREAERDDRRDSRVRSASPRREPRDRSASPRRDSDARRARSPSRDIANGSGIREDDDRERRGD